MTFNPIMGKLVGAMAEEMTTKSSVVELGNQTFTVTDSVLKHIIRGSDFDMMAMRNILALSHDDRHDKVADFYRALGFEKYTAIDVNEKYGSLMMDLNENLRRKYGFEEQFDLVTNNGTGEHIFNQYMVMRNMHQLAKPGGLMLHVMPFINWVNHGFYNFHPILYLDLAQANEYKVERLLLANRWGEEVPVRFDSKSQKRTQVFSAPIGKSEPPLWRRFLTGLPGTKKVWLQIQDALVAWAARQPVESLTVEEVSEHIKYPFKGRKLATVIRRLSGGMDKGGRFGNVLVVALLRKVKEDSFCTPIQGKYFSDIEARSIREKY